MTTTTHVFSIGDRVTFPPTALVKPSLIGMTFVVEDVPQGRRTNYRIRAEGGGPRYSVRPNELIPVGDAPAPSLGRPYVPIEFFEEGGIVTVSNGARKGIGPEEPYVVLKDSGRNTVNIAPVGGGQAWRWGRVAIVKRDLTWLTERLVELA